MKTFKYLSLFFTFYLCAGFHTYSYSSFDWKAHLASLNVEKDILERDYKGAVFFSLSTVCPCSLSHMPHFEDLSQNYPDYLFVGFHADGYASAQEFADFKKKFRPSFVLINDLDFLVAKALGAVTTPHAFVIDQEKNIVYQGAVSSSHTYDVKNKQHLKEALDNHLGQKKIVRSKTKPLGCSLNYKS